MALARPSHRFTIRDYVAVLFRRRWHLLLPPLVIVPIVMIVTFLLLPKIYMGEAIVQVIEPRSVDPWAGRQAPAPREQVTPEQRVMSYRQVILTRNNIQQTMFRLGLISPQMTPEAIEEKVAEVTEELRVVLLAPDVFAVRFFDRDAVLARNMVNTLLQVFLEGRIEGRRGERTSNLDVLEARRAEVVAELELLTQKMMDYQQRYESGPASPGLMAETSLLASLKGQLVPVKAELERSQRKVEEIRKALAEGGSVPYTTQAMELDPAYQALAGRLSEIELQLSRLRSAGAKDAHPMVRKLLAERASIEQKLREQQEFVLTGPDDPKAGLAKAILVSEEENVERLSQAVASYEAQIAEIEARLAEYPEASREMSKLQFQINNLQQVLATLDTRIESERVQTTEEQEKGTEYRIIQPAFTQNKPVRPNWLAHLLVSLVVSLALGAGFVFLAEVSDHTLHGGAHARAHLSVPVLAAIPAVPTRAEIEARRSNLRFVEACAVASCVCLIAGLIVGFNTGIFGG